MKPKKFDQEFVRKLMNMEIDVNDPWTLMKHFPELSTKFCYFLNKYIDYHRKDAYKRGYNNGKLDFKIAFAELMSFEDDVRFNDPSQ